MYDSLWAPPLFSWAIPRYLLAMRKNRIVIIAALVACASPAWAQPTPEAEDQAERITVLFTSDLRGALVDSGCTEPGPDSVTPLLPRVASAVASARDRAAREGELPPVLLDAGDALFPSPMIRDLSVERRSAKALVTALQSAGYDAMATGNTTLSAPLPAMQGILSAAAEAGLPMIASNLRCAPEDEEEEEEAEEESASIAYDECQRGIAGLTRRKAIVTRGDLRIGVFSVLPEDLSERVARRNIEGVEFAEPVAVTKQIVRELRSDGADLVVLLSHVDREETAPRRTLELLAPLAPEESPDLVIAASTAGLAISIRTTQSGPIVLAVSGDSLGRVTLERGDDFWQLVSAGEVGDEGEGQELTRRLIGSWHALYCERQARQVPGGELSGVMEEDDFLELALRVMREQTRSDIGVINTGVIADRRLFPLEGPLEQGHIRRALPFDNELRVAVIKGSALTKAAAGFVNAGESIVVGIEKRGTSYRVNGRDVEPDARYRLVTLDFVSEGGDNILDPDAFEFESAEPGPDDGVMLSERITNWLGYLPEEDVYDPDDRLDLYTRPLWLGSFLLDTSISDLQIFAGGTDYDQPQLGRDELFDLRLNAELRGWMSTRDHRWENLLVLRYGIQRPEGLAEGDSWPESMDLIQLRSAYIFDVIRNRILEGVWYGPSLYVEYQLESEFSRAEGDDGEEPPPHFLEMTGQAGLELKPLSWLRLNAGAGVRSNVLAEDNAPVFGINLRGEITRRRFFNLPHLPIYISALVDYFISWPDEGASHKLSVETRLEIQIYGPFQLTASARVFLYDEAATETDANPLALALDTTIGLGVVLVSRSQMY